MENILIVEDEAIVGLELSRELEKILSVKKIMHVTNSRKALDFAFNNNVSLILMDINLKGSELDGIDTALEIKKKFNIPIIFLTAYSDEETIKRAVAVNPAAYLLKPINLSELAVNINFAFYKYENQFKMPSIGSDFRELGNNYFYSIEKKTFLYKNMKIKLSNKEHILLRLLIYANNSIVKYDVIKNEIWGGSNVSESTLRTLIYRLRGKLEYKLIDTIPNLGCRLIKI